jgi:hypothetical protein
MIHRKYSLPYTLLVGILPEAVDFEAILRYSEVSFCTVVTKSDQILEKY